MHHANGNLLVALVFYVWLVFGYWFMNLVIYLKLRRNYLLLQAEQINLFFSQNGQVLKFWVKTLSFCEFVQLLTRVIFVSAGDKSWAKKQKNNSDVEHLWRWKSKHLFNCRKKNWHSKSLVLWATWFFLPHFFSSFLGTSQVSLPHFRHHLI